MPELMGRVDDVAEWKPIKTRLSSKIGLHRKRGCHSKEKAGAVPFLCKRKEKDEKRKEIGY